MTYSIWAGLLRMAPLTALLAVITVGNTAALAAPAADKPEGPIQDFDWLLDDALLKDDDDEDDDDDDDDEDVDAGDVIIERQTTTTESKTRVTQVSYTDISTNYWASDFIYRLSALTC
ncbi:uncharacterized protein XM38_017920 [Halomicronema hongdechloris C2206]|uniref:Uncharacterized protein n=1 Tax=Halomicronema hongdechloris C2206 TaxID=1641165 RepID=A0A1Z3HKN2_9CYAN|nr:hypothetical protein [Halomicronema hongdechloris]ASC70845.1 uncharacterized protein XM38_017920 [Halomicronema hongdechloris C2206]